MAEKKKKRKKAKWMLIRRFLQAFVRITGNVPGFLYFRTKRIYISKKAKKHLKGGALLVSNHTGFYDPIHTMVSIWYRRLWFLAAEKIYSNKFRKFFFSHCSFMIPIDNTKEDLGAVREVIARLKEGEMIVMFPEGHINHKEEGLEAFKQGMALMAIMGDAPILPVYFKKKESVRQRLVIGIGEPIYVDKEASKTRPLEYMKELTDLVYEKMDELEHLVEGKGSISK